MQRPRSRHLALLAAAALLPLAAAACSDDSDDDATDTTDTTAADSTEDTAAACDTWIEADTAVISFLAMGEGDADSVTAALDAAVDAADPEMAATLSSLVESTQTQFENPEDESASDETLGYYRTMVDWAGDNCDVERIEVTAHDYRFEGIPDDLTTGYTVVDFANHGGEVHEMTVFRIDDGVTETVEELLELPEEEVMGKVTMVNFAFAPAGESDTTSWNLAEPGDYVALCFISVGSVGETEGEGPPHFTEGMVHEFTVS